MKLQFAKKESVSSFSSFVSHGTGRTRSKFIPFSDVGQTPSLKSSAARPIKPSSGLGEATSHLLCFFACALRTSPSAAVWAAPSSGPSSSASPRQFPCYCKTSVPSTKAYSHGRITDVGNRLHGLLLGSRVDDSKTFPMKRDLLGSGGSFRPLAEGIFLRG